jgi:hypothetical protein
MGKKYLIKGIDHEMYKANNKATAIPIWHGWCENIEDAYLFNSEQEAKELIEKIIAIEGGSYLLQTIYVN